MHAWWVEGSATHVGWQVARHAGLATPGAIERTLRERGADRAELRPLREHERATGGDAAYALAARAVGQLVERSGSSRSLVRFCQRVGQGTSWRTAFQDAFGVSVDDFCREFERSRSTAGAHPGGGEGPGGLTVEYAPDTS